MLDGNHSALVDAGQVPVLKKALDYADEFFLTAAGQRNRNYVEGFVQFQQVPFAMEEVLLDPQTSGGLLIAAAPGQAETLLARLREAGLPAAKVGEIVEKGDVEILVKG